MGKKYIINATAMVPVHIGGGDEHKLDPLGYVVKSDSNGKNWFYRIDIGKMFAADSKFSAEFVQLAEDKNSIGRLRSLVADSFNPESRETWVHRAEVSNHFLNIYNKKINDLNNQLIVQCFPLANGAAYVPGSSIKGAVRTAVLDKKAEDTGYRKVKNKVDGIIEERRFNERKRAELTEQVLLNYKNIQDDPFKGIKVSDVLLPDDCTEISEVINVPDKTEKLLSLDMFVEVIKTGTKFPMTITIEDKAGMEGIDLAAEQLLFNNLMNDCFYYYAAAIGEEAHKHYKEDSPADKMIQKVITEVTDANSERLPGMSLIRVGRFSHLESMTYNDRGEGGLCQPRPPYNPKTKSPRKWGTSRNLVEGKIPLGLIKLEFTEK